jgi:hypothetical protein
MMFFIYFWAALASSQLWFFLEQRKDVMPCVFAIATLTVRVNHTRTQNLKGTWDFKKNNSKTVML